VDSNILKALHFIITLLKEKNLEKLDVFAALFADQFKKLLGTTGYDFSKASTLFECIG